jgi:hypothetical protein
MYIGGTKNAVEFIEKYKKSSRVIDFYSDEHLKSISQKNSLYSKDTLKNLDKKFGKKYRSHLLGIYIGDENHEIMNELGTIYAPFRKLFSLSDKFGWPLIKPDFLFINLVTQEILCVGLGRKNQIFYYELHKQIINNDAENDPNENIFTCKIISTECSKEFYELDHLQIIKMIIKNLETLGEYFFKWDILPGNSDVMVEKRSDGLYYLENDDHEGLTKSEVSELEADYQRYDKVIIRCITNLKNIFPQIERYDLNTGAYL